MEQTIIHMLISGAPNRIFGVVCNKDDEKSASRTLFVPIYVMNWVNYEVNL